MGLTVEKVAILLFVATLVSLLARKVKLPYTVGLVAAGLGIALLHLPVEIVLTKRLIFTAFLPPLLFEAAFQIPWKGLKRDLPVTLTLATLGVVLAAAVVTVGIVLLLHWPWQAALLLGVLISATDPVSVIATFKAAGVEGRLGLLVEAESLLNDGTAAVLFGIALAAATSTTGIISAGSGSSVESNPFSALHAGSVALTFVYTTLGGVLCGGLVGGALLLLAGHTDDHLVEIGFTTVAAYGSFLLAEHFHLSGVLATMTAGILLGNVGSLGAFSDKGREAVLCFWEYAGFVANSLIFLLMGMPLAHQNFGSVWVAVGVVTLLVLFGRAIAVYGCCACFAFAPRLKVSASHQHILFWGGLRGALALALVLGLPEDMPLRGTVTIVTFGVVAFSIVVQGVTMSPLLRRLGEIGQISPGDVSPHVG